MGTRREGTIRVGAWVGATLAALVLAAASASAQDTVRVAVEVEGLEGDLEANALAVMALARQEDEPLAVDRARALFERAPEEVLTALEPFGRYGATVSSDLEEDGDRWTARFEVDPGPVTRVERVDFALTGEGAADSGFVALADSFPVVEGDTLIHAPYEAAKSDFLNYATNKGYFDARFDSAQIRVDRAARSAEVIFRFDTGPRYRFGPITVEQDVLDPRYVNGYVTAAEGDPFDADLLRESQTALTTGPWFGRADIRMSPKEAEDGVVPVALVLEPARPQRYEVSVGYGTDTGPRASLGMRFRRLNRHAHHAQMKLEVSQIESSIAAQYNIPRPFPSTSVYSVFASFGDVSPTWSSTLIGTVGLRWTHERGPLRESFSMAWERSSYDVADRSGDATLVVAQAGWTWLRADDRLVTTRGHRLGLTVAGAHESVLSSASFLNAVVDGKIVRTLAPRLRALVRAQVGYILTDDLDELPPTRRFVTGGDQTIRGYEFETLGPTNVDGRLIGGDALAIGTIEFDYEVVPRWRAAVFTDAGNAWSDGAGVDVEYGVGAGVRWASPLGMIRLDGAFPVSDPDRSFRLHLVLGPDL